MLALAPAAVASGAQGITVSAAERRERALSQRGHQQYKKEHLLYSDLLRVSLLLLHVRLGRRDTRVCSPTCSSRSEWGKNDLLLLWSQRFQLILCQSFHDPNKNARRAQRFAVGA